MIKMKKLIEYKNIYKSYDSEEVINDFNLSINEGEFLCIVGSSGSGKTTLLKMINGLIKPNKGSILINNKNIDKENIINLRKKVGYAIQGNCLFPHMTVFENISYVLKLEKYSKQDIEKRVKEVMELVSLDYNIKDKFPDELSGGQQQRVNIARAYANNPIILLMDEPFGSVDSITRYQLQKDLKQIHKKTNCTIIFITHDIYEAFKMGTHILVLDKGKIVQYGTTKEVWENPKTEFVKKLIDLTK